MLQQLNNKDWQEAFGEGIGEYTHHIPDSLDIQVSEKPFPREDVEEVIYLHTGTEGKNAWWGIFRLVDGRWAYVMAWWVYNGVDYTARNILEVASSLELIISESLSADQRQEYRLSKKEK